MAATSETIKEFLVALGFKVDETSLKKFNQGITGTIGPVLTLGAAVTTVTTTLEAMVEKVARQMQDLYYQVQRSGVAAQTLNSVGYAARQLGLDFTQGTDLAEGFSRAMRFNPGVQGFLASLGGEFQTVNGQVGLTDKGLRNVLETLSKLPRYQALAYANVLGVSPDTLNTILNNLPQFEAGMDRARQIAHDFGLDLNKATTEGNSFSQRVADLTSKLETLADRAFTDLEPHFEKLLNHVDDAVTSFGEWSNSVGGLPNDIAAIAGAVGSLTAALSLFSAGRAAIAATFRAIVGGITGLVGAGQFLLTNPLFAFLAVLLHANPTQAGIGGGPHETTGGQGAAGEGLSAAIARLRAGGYSDDDIRKAYAANPAGLNGASQADLDAALAGGAAGGAPSSGQAPPNGRAPIGVRSNNPGNLMPGGHEAVYATADEGLAAEARNLQRYFARGRDTIASIIAKWAPAAAGNDVGAYINDVVGQTGYGANQKLNLRDPSVLAKVMGAITRHEQGYDPYGSDAYARAATSVTLNQTTNVTVNGVSDPDKAAAAVGKAQTGVNDKLARNFQENVR